MKVRTRILRLWPALGLLALAAVPASAGLIGQPVEVDYVYPTIGTVLEDLGNGTVTAGGYTVNSFGQHDFTVFDTQLVLQNVASGNITFTTASFNGYEVTETGGSPVTITGVTVDGATNVAGVVASDVSFDASHVWLNMQSLITDPGQEVVLDLTFGNSTVPEPGTMALLGLGLAAAGLARRFKDS